MLKTDASNTAIRAILKQQQGDGCWQPFGFFSHKLDPTEARYSTYDRELLAIHQAIKQFKRILEERAFIVETDHKPLTYAIV